MPIDEQEKDRPGKVFVGGLTPDVAEEDLEKKFTAYGRVTEVILIREKDTSQSRGYGFVTFENPLDAEDAVKDLDKKEVNGKVIHVEQAVKPKSERERIRRRSPDTRMRNGDDRRGSSDRRGGGSFRGYSRGGMGDRRNSFEKRGGYSGRRGAGGSSRRGGFGDRRGFSGMSDRRGGGGGGFRGSRGSSRGGSSMRRDRSPIRRDFDPPKKKVHQSRLKTFQQIQKRNNRLHEILILNPTLGESDRFGGPPRSRDYNQSPPRDYNRGPPVDSRMPPSRSASSRDYPSRDYPPQSRAYTPPPPSRDYGSRDYDRGPPSRDRGPPSSRDYGPPSREFNGGPSRSSFGSREPMSSMSRDDFPSSRDTYSRDPPARDYPVSRDFGSSRGPPARSYDDRGAPSRDRGPPPRDYDSYRDSGRSSGPPPSRFNGPDSGRSSGPPQVEVALHQVEMDLPQEGLAALVLQERLQIFQDHQEVLLGDLQVQGDHPLGKIEVGTEKALVLEVEDLLHLIAEDRLLKEQGLEAHQEEVDLHSDVKYKPVTDHLMK
ncbi:RBMX [Mytilus coruscus]|uniref:RBMX n=1 Tax=Mytilus coruscus TaxID=42192 RepID=A0A6J8D9M5_MYTCO|nr:RBMX [Mytilus coruscus]